MHPLSQNTRFFSSHRSAHDAGTIEWEELPSLAGWLAAGQLVLGASAHGSAASPAPVRRFRTAPVWDETRPAAFDAAPQSQPFREPLRGLAIREVDEPDVFHHFFGATPRATGAAR